MKTQLFFLLFILFNLHSYSIGVASNFGDLQPYKQMEGVTISYQEVKCETNDAPPQIAYIFELINSNDFAVVVEWDLAIWYNEERVVENISEGENHYVVELSAGEKLIGDCETPFGPLYIWKDFVIYDAPKKLTKFEFENLKISKK